MQLQELFDKTVKWEWTGKSRDEAEATFTVGKVKYWFYAYLNGVQEWTIDFRAHEGTNRFGLTGTGNSQQVLTTVISIIKDFLKIYHGKIEKMAFTAKEDSRISLYSKMVHRLIPSWKLEMSDTQPPTNQKHNKQKFLLTAPKGIN
jgi:hypothetical protein